MSRHAGSARSAAADALFDFSTRFGTAIPNPDLESERAVNYEFGWTARLSDELNISGRVRRISKFNIAAATSGRSQSAARTCSTRASSSHRDTPSPAEASMHAYA
jgi:outer membrane receptor protein involved in Fe transport